MEKLSLENILLPYFSAPRIVIAKESIIRFIQSNYPKLNRDFLKNKIQTNVIKKTIIPIIKLNITIF